MSGTGCTKFEEMLPKVLDQQGLEWEVAAVKEHLAGCASCASLEADLQAIGRLVREPVRRAVAEADFRGLWARVEAGIDRERANARSKARAERAPFFGRLLFVRLAAIGAVAAALFLAWRAPSSRPDDFAENDNRVDVESVEGGANNTVILYNSPDQNNVTVIWVEPESYQENGPT